MLNWAVSIGNVPSLQPIYARIASILLLVFDFETFASTFHYFIILV